MKTKFTLAILLVFFFSPRLSAEEIPQDKAEIAAENFLRLNLSGQLKGTSTAGLIPVPYSTTRSIATVDRKSAGDGETLFYIFNFSDSKGFIIISGDDLALPVLGYSLESTFDVSNVPPNFRKWMEGYKDQIRYIRAYPGEASGKTKEEWAMLLEGVGSAVKSASASVEPLITTRWNQSPYVNDLCPYDFEAGERTVTGCAATAMAQIMKYWDHPAGGSGFHSYNHDTYGTLSASFGNTEFDWGSMPDLVGSPNQAVATLMYQCGVSIEMDYGPSSNGGSGAYVITDRSPIEHCVEYALEKYFNYDPSLQGVQRSDYSDADWTAMLKGELDAGRPMEYAGFGSGGHAFVCDGYDSNDFFHFNWGWGGYHDGYFAIDALDPGGTGIGGGSGGYNYHQQALIGIRPPPALMSYDLQLYDSVTISENPLYFIDPYTIHTDIANFGETAFTGDYCAAVFDDAFNFLEFTEILEGASLGAGMHYTSGLDFSHPGSVSLLPGDYYAGIFYRPAEGDWKAVDGGPYDNLLAFEVYYSADIELYQDFVISTGTTITRGEPFTVTTDILNDASSIFTGEFSIDLYDMEGEYAALVQTLTGASLEAGYFYNDVEFSSAGVAVTPGTYLMALSHKPDGGSWTLSGSTYSSNPVRVIIREAPLEPDPYEENDTELQPFTLTLNFLDNSGIATTEGSNMHVGTDLDFYRVELENGFDYAITARVHDSYNSGNQLAYTNDVVWNYLAGEEWSEIYDDVMPAGFNLPGGGELLFGVAPYYEGETGTYLLEIRVTRKAAVSSELAESTGLKIYPNPASDRVFIEAGEVIDRIGLLDAGGRLIRLLDPGSPVCSVDISSLDAGIYYLEISRKEYTTVHKIVKP